MENYLTSNENFIPDNTLCSSCMFRTELLGKWGCGYCLYTGLVRNCHPTNCKKYMQGTMTKVSNLSNLTYNFPDNIEDVDYE